MRLIILGAPGSGKGTMAADLVREFHIPHISTGDIFRQNIKNETALGLKADQYIKNGALVPDDLTIAMVAERLQAQDCATGFMLDGFPRTVAQAVALDQILEQNGRSLDAAVELVVSDESILERLSSRWMCPVCGKAYNLDSLPPRQPGICDDDGSALYQRDDDKVETIKRRLANYYAQTVPLTDYYHQKDILVSINNEGEVGSALPAVLDALRARL